MDEKKLRVLNDKMNELIVRVSREGWMGICIQQGVGQRL